MAKKDNTVVIVAIVAIVALFLIPNMPATASISGGSNGGSGGGTGGSNNQQWYTNVLSINPTAICVGDTVTVSVNTNIPNGVCNLYANGNVISTVTLDGNGDFTQSGVAGNLPQGTYTGTAGCTDAQGNAKISNQVTLQVNMCAQPPPQQPNGGKIPCAAVFTVDPYLCPQNGYCAAPDETCTFIPGTYGQAPRCECRVLI